MYKRQKTISAAVFFLAAGTVSPFSSAVADEQELRQEILNLKHKVERLEKSRIPLAEDRKDETETQWFENITLSGLVEVEASYADTPEGRESDLIVATVELGIDAQLTDWVNAHVLFLYEDGMDHPEVDEALITIANLDKSPWLLATGRMYLPFGNFKSNMVSDPLTLEIGETREEAVQVGYFADNFYASAFLFNGDANEDGSSHIDDFGFNLGWAHQASDEHLGYGVGASWTSNLADSDSLQETITDPDDLRDKVSGIGLHGQLEMGPLVLIAEYLSATESFDVTDLAFDGDGAKPQSWNLEAGWRFQIMEKEAVIGMAWQQTKEAVALELPESRLLATVSVEVYKNTSLSLEYTHDKDYSVSQGGSGDDSDALTLQLAASF
ncbi:MAG TPA: LbtU family siderophore porin [Anaerolineae bacterium]|nr:LbtU family siderophore porin [Anaerolineae bacterium]